MSDREQPDLERALRHALRPLEPRAGLETRVMHAVDSARRPQYRAPRWALAWAAAATFVLLAAGSFSYREHVHAVRAEQTRAQVAEALRIANDKLETAFRLVGEVTGPSTLPARDDRASADWQFN